MEKWILFIIILIFWPQVYLTQNNPSNFTEVVDQVHDQKSTSKLEFGCWPSPGWAFLSAPGATALHL